MRVDVERRAGPGVAEAPSDGPNVDAGGDEPSGGEVSGGVLEAEARQAGATEQLLEGPGAIVRSERLRPAGTSGEDERVRLEHAAAAGGRLLLALAVSGEELEGRVVEGERPAVVGLGRAFEHSPLDDDHATFDRDRARVEVEIVPTQRGQLAATGAGRGRDAEPQREDRVLPLRHDEEPGELLGGRRPDDGRAHRRRLRGGRRVPASHPPDRPVERASGDKMDLQDRGRPNLGPQGAVEVVEGPRVEPVQPDVARVGLSCCSISPR